MDSNRIKIFIDVLNWEDEHSKRHFIKNCPLCGDDRTYNRFLCDSCWVEDDSDLQSNLIAHLEIHHEDREIGRAKRILMMIKLEDKS